MDETQFCCFICINKNMNLQKNLRSTHNALIEKSVQALLLNIVICTSVLPIISSFLNYFGYV